MRKQIFFLTKWMLIAFVVLASLSWLYLYLESVYQRRKAQRLVSELTSLPVAADFLQVRDLAISYGGRALDVQLDSPRSACTEQECNFRVEIEPVATKLMGESRVLLESLGVAGTYLGIHPWFVQSVFSVERGKLQHTHTVILQERVNTLHDYTGPILINYTVDIDRTATTYSNAGLADGDFVVIRGHVTGAIAEPLHTWAVQTPSGEWRSALDVRLDCLTAVLRGCVDFRQLAPPAWSHYEREKNTK